MSLVRSQVLIGLNHLLRLMRLARFYKSFRTYGKVDMKAQ